MGIKNLPFVIIISVLILILLYLRSLSKIKYRANRKVEEFNLDIEPRIDDNIFNDISRKLLFAGFEYQGDYRIEAGDVSAVDYSKSFTYKEMETKAVVIYTDIKNAGKRISKYTFTISTKFKDGYKVITRDSNASYLFKENNTYINEINNLEDINDAIRKHIEKVKDLSKHKELDPINEDYEVQLKKDVEDDYKEQVKLGILKLCGEGYYKFTLKGMIRGSIILTKFSFNSILHLFNTKQNSFISKQEALVSKEGNTFNKRSFFKGNIISLIIYAIVLFIIVLSVSLKNR